MARENAKNRNDKLAPTVIRDEELTAVAGGAALSSAISEVLKNFGGALQTAARSG